MRSSISSFKTELKVLLCVAVSLAATEVAMRLAGTGFSSEMAYVRAIPARAADLAGSKDFRVLILGNSLTREGFRRDVFCEEMQAEHARPMHVEVVALNGAYSCEWYYLLREFFANTDRMPDLIIVNGNKTRDQLGITTWRLATYLRAKDLPMALENDISGFGDRCDLLQSFVSSSFANRERVQLATLLHLVPHYQEGVLEVQNALAATARGRQLDPADMPRFHRLERLARLAQERGVPTLYVAMPNREDYDLEPGLHDALTRQGVYFMDCRDTNRMLKGKFVDSTHLGPEGASIFTREYARRLLKEMPGLFAARKPSPNAETLIGASPSTPKNSGTRP